MPDSESRKWAKVEGLCRRSAATLPWWALRRRAHFAKMAGYARGQRLRAEADESLPQPGVPTLDLLE